MTKRFGKSRSALLIALGTAAAVCGAAYAQAPGRTVWDGVFTAEQAAHGQTVYAAQCALCHGASLAGGDVAPAIAGPVFLGSWGSTNGLELFNRIRETMPIADPGSLSRADTADLVAYIFQSNGFPAGAAALPAIDPALANIVITGTKPGQ